MAGNRTQRQLAVVWLMLALPLAGQTSYTGQIDTNPPPHIGEVWTNRNPIGMWFVGDTGRVTATNPAGYDYVTDVFTEDFDAILVSAAEDIVARMDAMTPKPQGIIVWDLEGYEFWAYVGLPYAIEAIAPYAVTAWDDALAVFTNAGYRVGMTVRAGAVSGWGDALPENCTTSANFWQQQTFILTSAAYGSRGYVCDSANSWSPTNIITGEGSDDKMAILRYYRRSIKYAIDRWGASLFYLDSSNFGTAGVVTPDVYAKLRRDFPGVLLIPENMPDSDAYQQQTARYRNCSNVGSGPKTPRPTGHPKSFSVTRCQVANWPTYYDDIVEGVAGGDVLFFQAWYDNATITYVESAYADANP